MKLARILPRQYLTVSRYRYASTASTKPDLSALQESKSSKSEVKTAAGAGIEGIEKKPSFVKRLFLGEFDTDLLTYPEILDKERYETLNEMLKPIESFFQDKVDRHKIDQEAKIPPEVLQGLKDLGLFGLQIPEEYGGLGLNATEYARVGEIVSTDGSIGVTLAAHQAIGLKGLLLFGTEEQKRKYLPKLATGETVAAFCLTEHSSGSDAASIQTRAELSPEGTHWILNGSKIWISNGGIADFFTVFARTCDDNVDIKSPKRITAFAVERSFGGITNGKPEDKHGIRGSNTCEVNFENTRVPMENVIGEVGGGFKVAVNILNSGRFSMGSSIAGALKAYLAYVSDHVTHRKQFGKPLKDFGLIQEKLARLTIDIYVMESLAYLTAGMLDSNMFEDCAVEAAIVKVISSEMGYRGISECMQICGGMGYMKDQPFDIGLRDARIAQIFEGTNEILRLFIALMGVQSAGRELRELVKKVRNPFRYPGIAFEKVWQRRRHQNDDPKLLHNLKDFLHPSLKDQAEVLEYCVARLQYVTECCLEAHGAAIVDQQFLLKRLADITIDVYAMTAVLSRSSRSYCIGVRHAEAETVIAHNFCNEALARIKHNVLHILSGPLVSGDKGMAQIAEKVVENKGYFCAHPLERTFW